MGTRSTGATAVSASETDDVLEALADGPAPASPAHAKAAAGRRSPVSPARLAASAIDLLHSLGLNKESPAGSRLAEPEPEPEPEAAADLAPEPEPAPQPHYTSCYELSYVMLDKQSSPSSTALRELVWLPQQDAPCSSTVLVMLVYPTWEPNAPSSLLDDMMRMGNAMVTMALGSPFANPIYVPIRPRPSRSPGRQPPEEYKVQRLDLTATVQTEGRCGTLLEPADDDDGAAFDDEDDRVFQTPHASRDIPDDTAAPQAPAATPSSPAAAKPHTPPPLGRSDSDAGVSPLTPGSTGSEAAAASLSSMIVPTSVPRKVSQGLAEWATHNLTHMTGQFEKYAERKGISRHVPFTGVVVLEVDWSALTGFEYWNQLEQEGRMCMETNRVHKRRFRTVERAVQHYKLRPTDECARRCGLGVERDARSEIFNQPEKLTEDQRLKRQQMRMSPEGSSWRYIPWPQWSGEANDDEDDVVDVGNASVEPQQGESGEASFEQQERRSISTQSSGSSYGGDVATTTATAAAAAAPPAPGTPQSHFSNTSSSSGSEMDGTAEGATDDDDEGGAVELLHAQMLAIYFTCPFLPGAAGRLMLRAEQAKLLRDYEAGLPGWAVNLATNRFVPNLPIIGVWYRPRMRTLLTAVIIIVQVVSMICGFYDLWRNIPFIQPTLIFVWTPIYSWLIGPLTGTLSSFFSSIFSAVVTSGLSSLFGAIYHVFSFVLAPVISATFMAFQPLLTLFSPLLALTNTVLRTIRSCINVVLSGPRLAITSFGQLLQIVGAHTGPGFVVQFFSDVLSPPRENSRVFI
jgi:hypothetical protein